jgi:uncharacterized SAM-binding protein YcdF (DUF218 family)
MPPGSPLAALPYRPFDLLAPAEPPCPADAIFVFAGRPERKVYAVELWRRGLAPVLILSIGRFEWRRIPALGLPSDGGLVDLVSATPPPLRHFLLIFDRRGGICRLVPRGRFGTATEAAALSRLADERGFASVLVVSTAVHLRRIAVSLARVPTTRRPRWVLVAVPDSMSPLRRARWWASAATRGLVIHEWFKYLVYRLAPRRLLVPPTGTSL